MTVDAESNRAPATSAQPTVRRLILYLLQFILVVVAAVGASGLLGRLLESFTLLSGSDTGGLAQSLAFTLIGGPFAAVLWWFNWRRLADPSERASLAWGLYLGVVLVVSLIVFATALLTTGAGLVDGYWQPGQFATGIVWLGIWGWHWWMSRSASRSPARLRFAPGIVSSAYGLILLAGAGTAALAQLLDEAMLGLVEATTVGDQWWIAVLRPLVWAVGGGVIWWWFWFNSATRRAPSGFASVAIVVVGILGMTILTLVGAGTALTVLLRLAFDRSDSLPVLLDPLPFGLAAGAVGAALWAYHRGVVRTTRSERTRETSRLVTAGVALVSTASGIGVIVNATLAALNPVLVGPDTRTLLLGGISWLLVGGPLWWIVWRPTGEVGSARAASTSRRVYLVTVFGVSALVALITLIVIAFGVFEFALDNVRGESLIERIRAALGLLVATGLVAGYHFAVWRRDRREAPGGPPARRRTIEQVYLVTGPDAQHQVDAIIEASGAAVTVLTRADGHPSEVLPEAAAFIAALDAVAARRALVVVGNSGSVEVIPLQ